VFSFGIYYINRLIAQARAKWPPGIFLAEPDFRRAGRRARSVAALMNRIMEWYLPLIWAPLSAPVVIRNSTVSISASASCFHSRARNGRDQMTRSIALLGWQRNWLVGGAGLFVAFQNQCGHHARALSAAIVMLLALVFRGVAFDFVVRAARRAGHCLQCRVNPCHCTGHNSGQVDSGPTVRVYLQRWPI
jgi:hypothetical protein